MIGTKKRALKKDFYTTQELVKESWFPVRSTLTVLKLIKTGKLEAVDISTSTKLRRFRIPKESALTFIARQKLTENTIKTKKIKRKNKKK